MVRSLNKPGAVMAVLCAVAFMAQLDLFIVNVALPSMARSFHGTGLDDLSWVLNGYAIVFAATLVPAGRLADHLGRRRFLLWGVAVFTLASGICAAAPDLGVLVGARVLSMARQFGSALGVAILVAIYASPSPHSLSAFRNGWRFQGSAALLAAAASLVGVTRAKRERKPALPPRLASLGDLRQAAGPVGVDAAVQGQAPGEALQRQDLQDRQ